MESISRLCQNAMQRMTKFWQSAPSPAAATTGSSSSQELEKEIGDILEDLESIKSSSAWIKAAIADAEERAVRGDQFVRQWLIDLQQLAYRASDLLGLYEYEVLARQVREAAQKTSTATPSNSRRRAPRTKRDSQTWLTSMQQPVYRTSDLPVPQNHKAVAQDGETKGSSATVIAQKRKLEELDQVQDSDHLLSSTASPLIDPCFRREFARGIRKFREGFDEINKVKEDFGFEDGETISLLSGGDDIERQPTTGREPADDLFLGRDNDLNELIKLLLDEGLEETDPIRNCHQVPVIALVGMGGVGKTTLAQHAFNDPKVCRHYSIKGWVCVSDNFQVHRLTRSTWETLNEMQSSNFEEFCTLQCLLKDTVRDNKFLLVLDDIWNENVQLWDSFYSNLKDGAKGSKILISTRNESVAKTTRAVKHIQVGCLSEEHSWSLFENSVFGTNHESSSQYPRLVAIGKKIAGKCSGLPLGIKVLGGYLRCEDKDEDIWNNVLRSDLWEAHMWEEGKQVLGPLTLSYLRLPTQLKPCFVISSVFPKDHRIREQELVDFWIAHDLVEDYSEDTAMEYTRNLLSRSFFNRKSDSLVPYLVMHDLVHDLAQRLSRDKMLHGLTWDDMGAELLISHEVHHAIGDPPDGTIVKLCGGSNYNLRTLLLGDWLLDENYGLTLQGPEHVVNLDGLRTLEIHVVNRGTPVQDCLRSLRNLRQLHLALLHQQWQVNIDAICTLYNLRTLELQLVADTEGMSLPSAQLKLPDSIGNLRHLTSLSTTFGISHIPDSIGCLTNLCKLELAYAKIEYLSESIIPKLVNLKELSLFASEIRNLPESIGTLKALKVLDLRYCENLEYLPRNLVYLTNMTKLDLNGGMPECYFPVGLRTLTKLQDLPIFRVAKGSTRSEHAGGIDELRDLVGIRGDLSIGSLRNVIKREDAAQAQLMNKLLVRRLELEWGDLQEMFFRDFDSVYNMTEIDGTKIDGQETSSMAVHDEQVLESLRPHSNLEQLRISQWRGVRLALWLGDKSFVHLQKIYIRYLPNCTSLQPIHQLPSLEYLDFHSMPSLVDVVGPWTSSQFPVLDQLVIGRGCPQLADLADVSMPLLRELYLLSCDNLPRVPFLSQLEILKVEKFPTVFEFPFDSLSSTRILDMSYCDSLTHLCLNNQLALEELTVRQFRVILFLDLHKLPALKILNIMSCPHVRFSEHSTNTLPPSLEKLYIFRCPQLQEWCHINRHTKLAHFRIVDEMDDSFSCSTV